MLIDISLPSGRTLIGVTPQEAAQRHVPSALIGLGLKKAASLEAETLMNGYRARLASVSPGKLAEYRFKEEIAKDPENAAANELAMLDREALARGIERSDLLAEITAKAAAYREIALLIGALEAEAKASIAALADDAADIETQITIALAAATVQANQAFAEALALLNGGS